MENYSLDDTQPNAPAAPPAGDYDYNAPLIDPYESESSGGPGCLVWGLLGAGGLVFAVFIVLLAAYAGWTSGQREANGNATATRSADISEQMGRIPGDLNNGNLQLADIRIRYLMTMTPGVSGLPELAGTATQVYIDRLPTATPTPTATELPVEVTDDAPQIEITAAGGQYDLAALLQEAQTAVNTSQYEDAWELLDVIMAVDDTYERQKVRELLTVALNGQARGLFNSNNPASGIIWATRADELGVLQGDNQFELQAAILWQNARAAVGLNPSQAIPAIQRVLDLGQGRYYDQALTLMYQAYVAYGDALVNDPNAGYCPAVPQYESALRVQTGGPAADKLNNARSMCAQATPTPTPTPEGGVPEGEQPPEGAPPAGQ
jgi:hypothetical protein